MSAIFAPLQRLFDHYKAYHAYGPPRLKYMGYVGTITVALFYFLRFTRPNPRIFDDVALRAIALVLFAALALRERWPEKYRQYYITYSYWALMYCLPCFTLLTALQRGGGMPAISNAFIVTCFLVLLTDWRNTLVMLAAGSAMAIGVYYVTSPAPHIPMDLVAQIPAFALIVIGGNLFKFSTEQIDTERKLRATQALAGSIAHEMRTPLVQLMHNLQGMQQALPPPTTTAQHQVLGPRDVNALYRYLAQSEIAVKRGLQVIEMTLDEVSAKPLDTAGFAYLSAAEATGKAVQEYGYESEDARARIRLDVKEDFSFRGDETAYLFVLFNLLKNSLYYVAFHPQARVTITVNRDRVSVHDTGPGIAPDVLARLFEPFRSVGKTGGTGLGLAYCQRVMRAFGGEISCESVLGLFTEFNMQFPPISQADGDAHRMAVLSGAQAAFRGKRMLVVDDDATLSLTTRHKLQPLGAVIDEATDGQRAMELLARQTYDLVVLDLNMPLLDGYAVTERIRQGHVPANRDVCIVAYTSELAHVASVKTFKAGMDGFVSKPCAQLPLMQALVQAMEHPLTRARSEAAVLAGHTVLLADDNPYNRKAVAAYLKHAGVNVVEADHGQAVLDLMDRQGGWDAILMDINMPGMNGLETARAIRAREAKDQSGTSGNGDKSDKKGQSKRRAGVPIIALTAHSGDATSAAASAAGMDDFITKPVDAPLLFEKLARFIRQNAGQSADAGVQPQARRGAVKAASGAAGHTSAAGHNNAAGSTSAAGHTSAAANASAAPDTAGVALIDLQRLESFRHIGMLDELVNDYLPEIARLVERLERDVASHDMAESLETLHSLLGMSGEAGASALHRLVRRVYVPMVEDSQWPLDAEWLVQLKSLSQETGKALRAHTQAQPQAQPKTSSI
jgi:two-component system CAI-1 autoinducer sensor kinase/phosphatase CqsS